jgi:hypothetical protein
MTKSRIINELCLLNCFGKGNWSAVFQLESFDASNKSAFDFTGTDGIDGWDGAVV